MCVCVCDRVCVCVVQIRIHGIERTTKSFDARLLCDRRRYEYILPVWAFDPECCRGRSYYFNKTVGT